MKQIQTLKFIRKNKPGEKTETGKYLTFPRAYELQNWFGKLLSYIIAIRHIYKLTILSTLAPQTLGSYLPP